MYINPIPIDAYIYNNTDHYYVDASSCFCCCSCNINFRC